MCWSFKLRQPKCIQVFLGGMTINTLYHLRPVLSMAFSPFPIFWKARPPQCTAVGCHHLHAMVFSVLPLVTALQVGDKYSEQLKIQKLVYYNISKLRSTPWRSPESVQLVIQRSGVRTPAQVTGIPSA